MKIAAITITYNDDFKFDAWYQLYSEYCSDIYLHIIVDNNSEVEYLNRVKARFQNSKIIERTCNGGLTKAYNDGIREALKDPEIDAILIIANDIRVLKGSIIKLYDFLYSDSKYGMVSPIVMEKNAENIVSKYGSTINRKTLGFEHQNVLSNIESIKEKIKIVDGLPGGMNLSKREFYEVVGLQDENLFMYSDEIDIGIRGRSKGYKFAVTKDIKAWHNHINPPGSRTRNPIAAYLMARNRIYLAKKHFSFYSVIIIILYTLKFSFTVNLSAWINGKSRDEKKYWVYYFRGFLAGLLNNMNLAIFNIKN